MCKIYLEFNTKKNNIALKYFSTPQWLLNLSLICVRVWTQTHLLVEYVWLIRLSWRLLTRRLLASRAKQRLCRAITIVFLLEINFKQKKSLSELSYRKNIWMHIINQNDLAAIFTLKWIALCAYLSQQV